ncbi:unnamed protein product [Ostreobium quekettii]|uniref:Fungal lipase-type domain-containing protein n=1 Tax=Ostreobium quekettii TaxID=121088 RepID=A0A8S1J5F2_9CHLO|nr:unnamed protein product [Ostreobium quekettii]
MVVLRTNVAFLFTALLHSCYQDLLACCVLSECVYKQLEGGEQRVVKAVNDALQGLPAGVVHLDCIQCAAEWVPHRYLLAEGSGALYVCFMGTKQLRDIVVDANLQKALLWTHDIEINQLAGGIPAVHRGFLERARRVPLLALWKKVLDKGQRLVLCGHSLGGAVALLSTLLLLQHCDPVLPEQIKCITFACPPVANGSMARLATLRGWDTCLTNYRTPGDLVVNLAAYIHRKPKGIARQAGMPKAGEQSMDSPPHQQSARGTDKEHEDGNKAETEQVEEKSWRKLLEAIQTAAKAAQTRVYTPKLVPRYEALGRQLWLHPWGVTQGQQEHSQMPATADDNRMQSSIWEMLLSHRMTTYRTTVFNILCQGLATGNTAHPQARLAKHADVELSEFIYPQLGLIEARALSPLVSPDLRFTTTQTTTAARTDSVRGRWTESDKTIPSMPNSRWSRLRGAVNSFVGGGGRGSLLEVDVRGDIDTSSAVQLDIDRSKPWPGYWKSAVVGIPQKENRWDQRVVLLRKRPTGIGTAFQQWFGPSTEGTDGFTQGIWHTAEVKLPAEVLHGIEAARSIELTALSDFGKFSVPVQVTGRPVMILGQSHKACSFFLDALEAYSQKRGPNGTTGTVQGPTRWLKKSKWRPQPNMENSFCGCKGLQNSSAFQKHSACGWGRTCEQANAYDACLNVCSTLQPWVANCPATATRNLTLLSPVQYPQRPDYCAADGVSQQSYVFRDDAKKAEHSEGSCLQLEHVSAPGQWGSKPGSGQVDRTVMHAGVMYVNGVQSDASFLEDIDTVRQLLKASHIFNDDVGSSSSAILQLAKLVSNLWNRIPLTTARKVRRGERHGDLSHLGWHVPLCGLILVHDMEKPDLARRQAQALRQMVDDARAVSVWVMIAVVDPAEGVPYDKGEAVASRLAEKYGLNTGDVSLLHVSQAGGEQGLSEACGLVNEDNTSASLMILLNGKCEDYGGKKVSIKC